jgi:hypothetical protein
MEWIKVTTELDLTTLIDKDLLFIVDGLCYKGFINDDKEDSKYLHFTDSVYDYDNKCEFNKSEVSHYCIIELP